MAHVDLKCVSWHQKKDILAFISARNQVTIRDYGDSGEKLTEMSMQNSSFGTLSRFFQYLEI